MKTSKIVAAILGAALVLAFVVAGVAAVANAQSYQFTKNLKLGDTGSDVKMLQQVLNMDPATQVSASGAGSPGNESTYFGAKTRAAVIAYQKKYGITPTSGFFGPITRAQVNAGGVVVNNPGTSPSTPVVVVGGGLQVSAVTQPANSLAPQGASRVPFTKLALTAGSSDVTVNSITVERAGLAQDAVFSGLVLLDDSGIQRGISKTLNSNHQASVGEPFVVKAGTTVTVTVAGNMGGSLSSYAGQVVALNVVSVNTNGTVTGTLPVMGAAHTINATLSLGSAQVQVSSADPGNQSKEIGTTGQRFAGIRLTAGSVEKVRLWSIRFNQSESASSNDLANVKVNVGGIDYPTVVSADGKYYTATFGSGIVIDKGLSTEAYIYGDIIGSGAAGRKVQFDIYKNTDIYLTGETYGYGVIATPSSTGSVGADNAQFTATTPFLDASKISINAGSATTIAKANSVPAQFIAVNVPNQVLGGFTTDMKGEPISVQSLVFSIATSSGFAGAAGAITNISIVDENGAVVAGPVDAATTCNNNCSITFTDTVTFPIGKRTYTIKGQIPSGVSNNATITLTGVTGSWSNITGQVTGNTISLSGIGSFAMNPMTVKAAALTVSLSSSPSSQTIVAGTTGRTFANYQLDATQSGEDVRFSSMILTIGGTGTVTNLTGCQLYDGSTALNTGSNIVNPSAATANLVFDQSLTITKGTVKTLTLKCNVNSGATGTFVWGITPSDSNPSVTGVNSSADVNVNGGSYSALTGGTMTLGSTGSLVVSKHPSSPVYGVVAANTSGVTIGVMDFRAANEDVRLNKLGLTLTGAVGDLMSNGAHVTIWDGSTQVGTAVFTTGSTVATSTLTGTVTLPKDTNKQLTVKADLAEIGTGKSGTPGKLISVDYNSAQGTGADSGSTVEGSGSTAFSGVRLQKSYPIFSYNTSSGSAQNGTNDLLVLNVQAPTAGDVMLNKLVFSVATTTATASTFTFKGPSGDVSSSSPILNAAGTSLTVYFDSNSNVSDRTVPAGTTRTYTLRTTNLSLTGTNSTGSISVALKADTANPSFAGSYLMASTTVAALTSQNVLWSPISTSSVASATITLDDWTNGYGLPGCFKDAGLGSDCAARTVSK